MMSEINVSDDMNDWLWEKSRLLNELLHEPTSNEERWTMIYSVLMLAYYKGKGKI